MTAGTEGEDMEALLASMLSSTRGTIESRREKETRPVSRPARGAGRTEQLNLTFRPGFKRRLQAVASDHGQTMTQTLEKALESYIKETGWGKP